MGGITSSGCARNDQITQGEVKCDLIVPGAAMRHDPTHYMSRVVRKPDFCICVNKDADQLRGNREADQRLCFRYSDSAFPLLPKSEISSLWSSYVVVQPCLCRTWSETPKTGFLRTRLILYTYIKLTTAISVLMMSSTKW